MKYIRLDVDIWLRMCSTPKKVVMTMGPRAGSSRERSRGVWTSAVNIKVNSLISYYSYCTGVCLYSVCLVVFP